MRVVVTRSVLQLRVIFKKRTKLAPLTRSEPQLRVDVKRWNELDDAMQSKPQPHVSDTNKKRAVVTQSWPDQR